MPLRIRRPPEQLLLVRRPDELLPLPVQRDDPAHLPNRVLRHQGGRGERPLRAVGGVGGEVEQGGEGGGDIYGTE